MVKYSKPAGDKSNIFIEKECFACNATSDRNWHNIIFQVEKNKNFSQLKSNSYDSTTDMTEKTLAHITIVNWSLLLTFYCFTIV